MTNNDTDEYRLERVFGTVIVNASLRLKGTRKTNCDQRSYSYAKIFVSARSLRDLNEVTPPGGRRSRKQ